MSTRNSRGPICLIKFVGAGVVILVDTKYGPFPVWAFPTREDFTEFASVVQDFYNKMKPDVPDVFKQAFEDNGNS